MTVEKFVRESTAKQLGVNEGQINSDTVIPDMATMALFASVEFGKVLIIDDVNARCTVREAIEIFEQ